jgi:hypothetical protein
MNMESGSVISGFRRDVDEMYDLLGYYAALSGNALLTFRDNISVPSSRVKKQRRGDFFTIEEGTYTLARNVSKGLPLDVA